MQARPAPPVPPECDLTGYDWFPLHFRRLQQSVWWLGASDLARSRNVDLWSEAYQQVPAASLPDSDVVLAKLAGFGRDLKGWAEAKAEILAPWTLCDDGRWYHLVLAEVALEAWERAGVNQRRAQAGAAARWGRDRRAEAAAEAARRDTDRSRRQTRSERLSEARKLGRHTASEWEALLVICGHRCVRCGDGGRLVKDHIEPIYQGGSDGIDNIQPLCARCNCAKGPDRADLRPADWRSQLVEMLPERLRTPALSSARSGTQSTARDVDERLRTHADACHRTETGHNRTGSGEADASPSPARGRAPEGGWDVVFMALEAAYPERSGRGSPVKARMAFDRLPADVRLALPAAAKAYAEAAGWGSKGPPALARWLGEEFWRPFLADRSSVTSIVWAGPPELRAAVAAEHGEPFARSYLDPAEWVPDGPGGRPSVIPLSDTAAVKLGGCAALEGVTIGLPRRRQA